MSLPRPRAKLAVSILNPPVVIRRQLCCWDLRKLDTGWPPSCVCCNPSCDSTARLPNFPSRTYRI